jgi:hypothetical protein
VAKRGRPPKGFEPLANGDLGELMAFWDRALQAPRGIVIASERPQRLLARLYEARRVCGGFGQLKAVEGDGCVWIVPR